MLPALSQPVSRTEQVRDALRRAILRGDLPPGRPLVERELAVMLGVSKTPVREALKLLQSTGLVQVNSYQAVTVRSVDEDTVREVYEARLTVEPGAVRLGVKFAGKGRRDAAQAALAEAEAAMASGDTAAMALANRQFHRELYAASENTSLIGFLDHLHDLSALLAAAGWRHNATYEQEAAQHRAILDAAEGGEAAKAERLLQVHIDESFRAVQQTVVEHGRETSGTAPADRLSQHEARQ